MRDVRNLRIPSTFMLQILTHMYFNGITTFKSQNIYNDPAHFRRIMKKLIKWNVARNKKTLENGRFVNGYTINGNGIILIEEFIYDYHKCTEKFK